MATLHVQLGSILFNYLYTVELWNQNCYVGAMRNAGIVLFVSQKLCNVQKL